MTRQQIITNAFTDGGQRREFSAVETPTFAELCGIEPGLAVLAQDAREEHKRARGSEYSCANEVWYQQLEPEFVELAGWHARREELRTAAAYDLAYDTIYALLPDCL